jgi:ATP-dependent helicase/DNAse subunit B
MHATTVDGEKIPLNIGGRIDRIDHKGDTIEIVDYKTGGEPDAPENIEALFSPTGKRSGYIFQAMLYSAAMAEKEKEKKISPSLLYIHNKENAEREDFIVKIDKRAVTDFKTFCHGPANENSNRNIFLEKLQETINEIFNINEPFTRTEEKSRCKFCCYRSLCGGK